MKIKICGLTVPENIFNLIPLHPDYMGFIFYKKSPRDVSRCYKNIPFIEIPSEISKVAVCVDMPYNECVKLIKDVGFDFVQLHGNESPEYCSRLKQSGVKIIKSFSVADRIPDKVEAYMSVTDYFLFDSPGIAKGGNGTMFNHKLLTNYPGPVPFFLAGGLRPSHTYLLNEHISIYLHALDLNSGFESSVGIKDANLISEFIINNKSNE